jgi:hypothetical protein
LDEESASPAVNSTTRILTIEVPNLKATEFASCPTEEEIMALLRVHKDFWTKVSGLLFVQGKYSITDQQQRMNKLLGLAAQTQMVIDAFQGTASIAVPQQHLVQR